MSDCFSIFDDIECGVFRVYFRFSRIGIDLPSVLLGSFDSFPEAVDFINDVSYRLAYECLPAFSCRSLPKKEWSDIPYV